MIISFSRGLLAVLLALLCVACRQQPAPAPEVREVVRYVEKPVASVSGTLTVPDGMAAHSIVVFAEGTSHLAFSDREGRFELSGLPAGTFLLRATRDDLEPIELEEITIAEADLDKPQPFLDLGTIRLEQRELFARVPDHLAPSNYGEISGRVLTTNPLDTEGVVVDLLGTPLRTATAMDGSFLLLNVPPGEYMMQFRKPGYGARTASVVVEPGVEAVMADVRLSLVDPGGLQGRTIIGAVSMSDMQGNPEQRFELVNVFLEGTAISTSPGPDGRFGFTTLPPGVYVVAAQANGYLLEQRFQVDLTEIDAAEVNLSLRQDPSAVAQLGTVAGQVTLQDPPPSGMVGVAVSLVGTSAIAMTDAQGFYVLESIRPGMYDLVATMTGYESGFLQDIDVRVNEMTTAPPLELLKAVQAPKVVRTTPVDGASDVSISDPTVVVITFDQKMDQQSLLRAIRVTPEVEFTVALSGMHPLAREDQVVVLLSGYTRSGVPLKFNTRYSVQVARSASNMEGVPMDDDFVMVFRTGPAKIISTWPTEGQEGVWVWYSNPIRVYFNAPINPEGFQASDITVRPQLSTQPSFYFQADNRTGWSYLSISGPFESGQQYTVTLRGRLRTITGDRVSNVPYQFRFRTSERIEGGRFFDERTRRELLDQERRRR